MQREHKNYEFINNCINTVIIRLQTVNAAVIAIYAPEEGKEDESKTFFEQPQSLMNKCTTARVTALKIEKTFCLPIVIKGNIQLFQYHRYKYTWVARGQRSIID